MADSLTEIATRHQVYLEGLKTHQARNFTKVLSDLDKAITSVLAKLDGRVSDLGKRDLNKVLKKLQKAQKTILVRNEAAFLDELERIAGYEARFEARALDQHLRQGLAQKKIKVPPAEEAFVAATRTPLSATGELLKPFISHYTEKQISGINNAVRKAWSEGRTVYGLTKEIRGTKALKYRDGILQGVSRRQAEAVARTAVQHVASRSRMTTWEKNQDVVRKYRFTATLDPRTTAQCRSLDGREFEINRGPTPPVHINCRSTTVPVLKEEFKFLEKGRTRASVNGPVKANQTYYQWLKKQPRGFQADAIGPTRAKLLRDGGLSAEKFSKLQLDRNFNPLTLDELQLKEPLIFERAGIEI